MNCYIIIFKIVSILAIYFKIHVIGYTMCQFVKIKLKLQTDRMVL